MPPIIANASSAKQPEKKVLAGVINSALFTTAQHEAIDGIVRSSLPGDGKRHSALFKVVPGATAMSVGNEHVPGTLYPQRR